MLEQASSFPVLDAMCARAGTAQDREFGGLLSVWAGRVTDKAVRHVRLRDGVARSADAALPARLPGQPTYVEWSGLGALLMAKDAVPCAAMIAPVLDGYFQDAVSVHFFSAPGGGLLPFPGAIVVDAPAPGALFSRVDRLRISVGGEPASGMSERMLKRADRRVEKVDGYWVRHDKGNFPARPPGRTELQWQSWIGHGLEQALTSTCVEADAGNPMFGPDRSEDVRTWANRIFGFMLWTGPASALKLLNLLDTQTNRMN